MALVLALALLLGGPGIDPAPQRPASPRESPRPAAITRTALPRPATRIGPVAAGVRGTASWGYGWSGVVTRLPRGTRIRVTGPLGEWVGRSVGYGPALYTHRVADLSRAVFASICGDPSRGLCRVTVSVGG